MNNKVLVFVLLSIYQMTTGVVSAQSSTSGDSLTVFVIGWGKGERIKIQYDNQLVLSYKAQKPYIYSFKIAKEKDWERTGQILDFFVYRKGHFGFRYKVSSATVDYQADRKFLVFNRAPFLKNYNPFLLDWTNKEPTKPYFIH
jgi:hypothetical protein